ncbi:MAG: SUMF1/EgtB/PvdO family nonheme iron enzyme [Rhodospirillales bacterium]
MRVRLGIVLLLLLGALVGAPPASAQTAANPFGVAIIIGNDYRGTQLPTVDFAGNDADAIAAWVVQAKGFDPRNVVVLKNATAAQLVSHFGTAEDHRGRLWQLMRRNNRSDVVVFFSGHGMPNPADGAPLVIPQDADGVRPHLNGYPLDLLYSNLQKLDAKSVLVLVDACFSGGTATPGRSLIPAGSPVFRERPANAPQGLAVLTAAGAGQVASWDLDARRGLFTHHFLQAVSGKVPPKDGQVTLAAVKEYLDEEMTYAAQRAFGREQHATLQGAGDRLLPTLRATPVAAQRPAAPPSAPAVTAPQPAVAIAPVPVPDPSAAAEAALGLSVEERRKVQTSLSALGFDPRGIDGQFGPGTRGAIRAFQKSKNLPETGFLSAEVVTALAADGPGALAQAEEARRAREAIQAALRPPSAPAAPSPPPVQRGGYPAAVGQSFRDCADCPEMVVIPAGSGGVGENASSTVSLREPLAVGKFHVTVAEYRAFVNATGGRGDNGWQTATFTRRGGGRQTDRDPVVNVSWEDAQAYVRWLSQRTGRGYRLLSEAEWEYAARAGTTTTYFWGNDIGRGNANCDGCGSQWDDRITSPVGSFPANRFGLHDMAGNALQWVEDCWSDRFPTSGDANVVMSIGSCDRRVLRGGSWGSFPTILRSANRYRLTPGTRDNYLGFRVARTPGG